MYFGTEEQQKGLNFVPMMAQTLTPPHSGRFRSTLISNRSQRSFGYYNGNYEGDSSMFSKSNQMSPWLDDSDSDYCSKNDSVIYSKQKRPAISSLICHQMEFLLIRFLKPQKSEKILKCLKEFKESLIYLILAKCFKIISIAMANIFYLLTILISKPLLSLGNFLWKERGIFQKYVRLVLWKLISAKCQEFWLYIYVLIGVIALVPLSLMGLIISIFIGFRRLPKYSLSVYTDLKKSFNFK